jgi:hypothetical protein
MVTVSLSEPDATSPQDAPLSPVPEGVNVVKSRKESMPKRYTKPISDLQKELAHTSLVEEDESIPEISETDKSIAYETPRSSDGSSNNEQVDWDALDEKEEKQKDGDTDDVGQWDLRDLFIFD